MPRSLLGFLCVPPVPYLCNSVCPTLVSAVWTVCEMPSSQSLSEVRVVLVSPQHMAGSDVCLVKAAIWGGRQILFWQPVRPALGPSWTMTTMSNLPWHHQSVNSQFSICLGNYQFWSKSFWCAELWALRMDSDTSILSSAWPEKLMSEKRKNKHQREKIGFSWPQKLGRCVNHFCRIL